jgi:hypothetical protein
MNQLTRSVFYLCCISFCIGMAACKNGDDKAVPVLFEVLKDDKTGLHFNDQLAAGEKWYRGR